jgi:hypothetical protein
MQDSNVDQLVLFLTENPIVTRLDQGRLRFLKHQEGGFWFEGEAADLFVPLRNVIYTETGFRVANIAYTYICEESDNMPESVVGRIVDYEMGLLSEDEVTALYQEMFDSGLIWCLNEPYQVEAKRFLDAGLIKDNSTPQQPVTNPLVLSLIEKLGPGRVQVSHSFQGILAYLLGRQRWVEPQIKNVYVTEHNVLVVNGSVYGDKEDLIRNINGVCDAAHVTPEERDCLLTQVSELCVF